MLGWFVRIALVLAVVGTLAFDSISIAQAHARADDTAAQAATAAVQAYSLHRSLPEATAAAARVALAADAGVVPRGVVVHPDGSATVTVRVVPHTTLLGHLPWTGGMVDITSTGSAARDTS